MKKFLVLFSVLITAAACATTPTNTGPATTANANVATKSKSTASLSEADAIAKEKAAWDAIKRQDLAAFGDMLASDYVEVAGDGVYNKTDIITSLKDFKISDVTYSDWKALPIDEDAVILKYNVTVKATNKGQAVPPGPYHSASAWVNRDGKWLAVYYQETLAKTSPPPPPSSRMGPPAKATASPASKMAEAGPDSAANEKLVWDAIKSRNYDAFAAFLAPEFIEVEADGVYDKAGSVKAVSTFDASKAELSDWKTVKFDNDAALVTYTVKLPSPQATERHGTIWANRNGKWLAVFHQGTPVMPAQKM
jgi:hypothetical protein